MYISHKDKFIDFETQLGLFKDGAWMKQIPPPYDHCTGELDHKITAKCPKLSRSK